MLLTRTHPKASYWLGLSRLRTLCELHMSKVVEKKTERDIIKADIDVIGLLREAQEVGANQLAAFCLHFVSANYQVRVCVFVVFI